MKADRELEFDVNLDQNGDILLSADQKEKVRRLFYEPQVQTEVIIREKKRKRSKNANAYYWAVVVEMTTEAFIEVGEHFTQKNVHDIFRTKFLKVSKMNTATGEVYEYVKSTSDLYTFEFTIYLHKCIQMVSEWFSIVIPEPHKVIDRYSFPEFQGLKEGRAEYLARIGGYLQDISDKESLRLYFLQNSSWKQEPDVRDLFNKRHLQLKNEI